MNEAYLMSWPATMWAWRQPVKGAKKLVLTCLAYRHNSETGQCNPALKTISDDTGLNIKTVRESINFLQNKFINWEEKGNGNRKYSLFFDDHRVPESVPLTDETEGTKNGTPTVPKTVPPPTKNGTPTVPKTVPEIEKNFKKNFKKKLYKKIDLSDLPDCISIETAKALVDHRVGLKKPLVQSSFSLLIKKSQKPNSLGYTPDQVITECMSAGWAGIETSWLENKYGDNHAKHTANTTRPNNTIDVTEDFIDDEYRARIQRRISNGTLQ